MIIRPTYSKSYLIRYSRGKEVQTTEVVDTTTSEIDGLIKELFKGRFSHSGRSGRVVPTTNVQVIELDHIKKSSRLCGFSYTKNGELHLRSGVHICNLSPREVRIELEKAIRNRS